MEHRLSPTKTPRDLVLIEATSFLVVLVATSITSANDSATGVTSIGPVHGPLFLAYVLIVQTVRRINQTTLGMLLSAVVPFGGFVVDRWLAKNTQRSAAGSHRR